MSEITIKDCILVMIAGGETPETLHAKTGIPISQIENVVEEDLQIRRELYSTRESLENEKPSLQR
jgi:hypothetical protein